MSFRCQKGSGENHQDLRHRFLTRGIRPFRYDLLVWRGAVCLLLGSVTILGVGPLNSLSSASAQVAESTSEPSVGQLSAAIAISSAEDAVQKFSAANHLYIKGSPITQSEIEHLKTILQQNPNIYVVLIDNSSDVVADDMTLSQGIGNSTAFQSVVNAALGEREGVLFMVYFDSDQGRKIYMRAEALPDQLNVGESNFASPSGNPRELLSLFVNAVQNEGKDVPTALEVVIQRINGTIQQHVGDTVSGAEQALQQADAQFAQFQATFETFQAQHNVGGPLGNPEIAGWTQQLDNAKTAFENRQFAQAETIAQTVRDQIQVHEQAMNDYGQAPAIAQTVAQRLETLQGNLSTLDNNGPARNAVQLTTQARQAFDDYQSQYQSGSLDFWQPLQVAQETSEDALGQVEESMRLTALQRRFFIFFWVVMGMTVAVAEIVAHRRASRQRQQAERELADVTATIDAKTQALIALMDKADYAALANYTGATDQRVQQLVARVTDALILVGGAQKFLAEAEALIRDHRFVNAFRTINFDKAIALLTNPETHLTFAPQDSVRAVMTQESVEESWRQSLLKQATSQPFEKSLRDVLLAMAEHRDAANILLEEITSKDVNIAQYLTQIETEANDLKSQLQLLQEHGQRDQNFRLDAVAYTLFPMILADEDEIGLIAHGRELMNDDPIRAWDDYGVPAQRMTQDAAAIIAMAQDARTTLVPTLSQAHQTLTSHNVQTNWAYERQRHLSEELEAIAKEAIRIPISEDLQPVQQDIAALMDRIQQVVRQDQARRDVCPPLITAALDDVARARQEIHDALKQAGAFLHGTVQQVLREPDQDPSDNIEAAQATLEHIKSCLDQGDTEAAETFLTNINTLTQDAHESVRATRDALAHYPLTLHERQQRTDAIQSSIASTYQITLSRILNTYADDVLQDVASEVESGNTIANNLDLTHNLLQKARVLLQNAQDHYQNAYLLTARALLDDTDRVLKGAQHQLNALTSAEEKLGQYQHKAESDLVVLTETHDHLHDLAQAEYVRVPALNCVERADQFFMKAQNQVHQQPYHPYQSREYLTEAETVRAEAVQLIQADQKAYEHACTAIDNAKQALSTAAADILLAKSEHFAHARVHTHTAEEYLSEAQWNQQQAHEQFGDRAYEAAHSLAGHAVSSAHAASHAADHALEQAEQVHYAEVRRREAEASRRRAAMTSASFYGSSGSSVSSSGGSSGSSGGSWGGGGGSGSSGGSW